MNEKIKTPHINPTGEIAKTVLMPGDPLRAKYIAETFLDNVVQFNNIRGMLGYTGTYQGKQISVMGSGMGMPSIGIYSYELFNFFGVENIIRIGSAGAYTKDLNLFDVVLAKDCWSLSTYAKVLSGNDSNIMEADKSLNERILNYAKKLGLKVIEGRLHSSDVFYYEDKDKYQEYLQTYGCICVEMEAFALFANAKLLGKKAACLVTISDSIATKVATTAQEREVAFNDMMKIALEFAE